MYFISIDYTVSLKKADFVLLQCYHFTEFTDNELKNIYFLKPL
jgi:hypothetical protein